MSRTDDVINVAGYRLSTGAIEEVLASHNEVAECVMLVVSDYLKGQLPIGLVVLNTLVTRPDSEITAGLVARVRQHIGPVVAFKTCHVVARLPKTYSGKILRATRRYARLPMARFGECLQQSMIRQYLPSLPRCCAYQYRACWCSGLRGCAVERCIVSRWWLIAPKNAVQASNHRVSNRSLCKVSSRGAVVSSRFRELPASVTNTRAYGGVFWRVNCRLGDSFSFLN